MKFRPLFLVSLLALCVGSLTGCGDPHAATNYSIVRVFNGLIGVPNSTNTPSGRNVDFLMTHGYPPFSNVPFQGQTARVNGRLGGTDVTVTITEQPTVLVPTTTVDLPEQKKSILVASGVIGGTGRLAPRLTLLPDVEPPTNFAAEANSPTINVAIRLVHLSPDASAIPLLGAGSVSYGNISPYIIYVGTADKVPGTTDQYLSTGTIQLNTPFGFFDIPVVNGSSYTVYLTGLVTPGAGQEPLATTQVIAD